MVYKYKDSEDINIKFTAKRKENRWNENNKLNGQILMIYRYHTTIPVIHHYTVSSFTQPTGVLNYDMRFNIYLIKPHS